MVIKKVSGTAILNGNVVDGLEDNSTTNAPSQRAVNELKPIILYENESGYTGNITLNDHVENYSYIEILYSKNGSYFNSTKVPKFAYHSVCLMYSYRESSSNLTQMGTKVVSFSGKTMTSGQAGGINVFGSSGFDAYSSNEIYVHQVMGYK